jgi:hypothetical protein
MHYIQGKGYFEASGKPVGSKRKVDMALARSYGASGDRERYTRLLIESRVSRTILDEQFHIGARAVQ